MSKRFGRNQKRAMQAELAAVKANYWNCYASLAREAARADQLEQDFAQSITSAKRVVEVVRSINPDSIALSAATVIHEDHWIAKRTEPLIMLDVSAPNEPPKAIDFTRIPLYELEAELRDSNEFRDAVHFEVQLQHRGVANQCAAWRGSREALWHGGVERIAGELAKCLHKELQQGY